MHATNSVRAEMVLAERGSWLPCARAMSAGAVMLHASFQRSFFADLRSAGQICGVRFSEPLGARIPIYESRKARWQARHSHSPWVSPCGRRFSSAQYGQWNGTACDAVSYTHLRAHETVLDLVCRLLL